MVMDWSGRATRLLTPTNTAQTSSALFHTEDEDLTEVPSSDEEEIALADSGAAESPAAAGDTVCNKWCRRRRADHTTAACTDVQPQASHGRLG
jgi:hypothetical protein